MPPERVRYLPAVAAVAVLAVAIASNAMSRSVKVSAPPKSIPALAVGSDLSRQFSPARAMLAIEDLPVLPFQQHLGADDLVYKRYTDPQITFQVFVAHWRPGNRNVAEASGHLPEACWGLSGWRCVAARRFTAADSRPCVPADWRQFVGPHGERQEVLFWCVAGKVLIPLPYRGTAVANAQDAGLRGLFAESGFLGFWRDKAFGTKAAPSGVSRLPVPCVDDVYFVRVNTSASLDAVFRSRTFEELFPAFVHLGLGMRE